MSLPISHRVAPAAPEDLKEIAGLLGANGLSAEGLERFLGTTLVSRSRGEIIGCAALEVYGDAALLRSVAVDVGWQARGLGAELVAKAIRLAQARGVREMFLLTMTAADYFARHGFAPCARDDAPDAMKRSIEFTTLCPTGATAMRRAIEPPRLAVRTPRARRDG
ncbi:MAG TPA: arsenic resistance N-acetyltransferase ArsN2 [Candidatus Krumholzibacteria bacterium]|nr:arsenic resistance N-acetyltransferase ArsN2 [Candidatus Krumholzibacteria bacterium]